MGLDMYLISVPKIDNLSFDEMIRMEVITKN